MLVTSAFAALVAVTAVAAQSTGPNVRHALLKDVRSEIGFAPYTPEQKVLVAQQAQEMLDIFVHQDLKKQHYGVDAVAGIAAMVPKAGNMTDAEFNYAMSDLFLSFRDFHTNYFIPGTHQCYRFLTPFQFDFVESRDIVNDPTLAVRAVAQDATFLKLMPGSVKAVKPGDTLVAVDGKSFRQYWQETQNRTGGANQFGGYRAAMKALNSISGRTYRMPEKDEITFTFKRGPYSRSFDITVPYVALANKDCLAEAPGSQEPPSFAPVKRPRKQKPDPKKPLAMIPDDLFDIDFGAEIFPDPYANLNLKPTKSNIVKWTIYNRNNANLGIIRLSAFLEDGDPTNGGRAKLALRNLLLNELKNTDAVVIDIRANGGGYLDMADHFPQFFVADYVPGKGRALVSKNNEKIFVDRGAGGEDWKAAYLAAKPGDRYSASIPFSSVEETNSIGNLYIRPVAILNNANCYSACDTFSAAMQDHGVLIFGEDGTTGAGGANVITHSETMQIWVPDVFKPLPYQEKDEQGNLPLGVSDMRVSWRQTIRAKKHAGELIEDTGILADEVVRPTIQDLVQAQTGVVSQFDRIAAKLKQYGALNRKNGLYFQSPLDETRSTTGKKLTFAYESQNIKRLEIRDPSNKVLGTASPVPYFRKTSGSLQTSEAPTTLGHFAYTILGYDVINKQVLKTKRSVVIVPGSDQYLKIQKGSEWTFGGNGTEPFVGVYNSAATKDANGWVVKDGRVVVGAGTQYVDNVSSTLSIFANIPSGVTATVSAAFTYDTEKGFDYFSVYAKPAAGGQEKLLFKVDGNGTQTESWALDGLTGEVEVGFRFESDGGVTAKGVSLDKISIKA